jgi:hypothetical protein
MPERECLVQHDRALQCRWQRPAARACALMHLFEVILKGIAEKFVLVRSE